MIELSGVIKHYGSPAQRTAALNSVNLRIADGEFVVVVGPSGCGKTTLLNLVAGFEQPTDGIITMDQAPVLGPSRDRAVVFQQPNLYPWLSVRQNIGLGLKLRGDPPETSDPLVLRYLQIMGLEAFADYAPYHLSGGMRQRVAIARALILEPRVLLMDEPFGALDANTRQDMQRFLLDLWQRLRPTVLFITHDVEEAVLLGDRVLVMTSRPGTIAEEVAVPFSRPRHLDLVVSDGFLALKRKVLGILRPDVFLAPPVDQPP
jgi:NitT/TauT family transport system ATP-binding protein